jgi:hypothetical protein
VAVETVRNRKTNKICAFFFSFYFCCSEGLAMGNWDHIRPPIVLRWWLVLRALTYFSDVT